MNIEQLKAHIADLKAQQTALRSGDQTLDAAKGILKLKGEIAESEAELVTLVAAFEEVAEAEEEVAAPAAPAEAPAAPAEAPAAPAEAPAAPAEAPAAPAEAPAAPQGQLAASAADVSPVHTETTPDRLSFSLVASGSGNGVNAGQDLTREDVLAQLQRTLTAAGSGKANGRLFEIETNVDESEVVSERNGAIENSRIIRKAMESQRRMTPLTAGGCFCGPDELIRETGVVGDRGRPVAGVFASVASKGGFRAMPDLAFNVDTPTGSTAQWTCADQGLVDPNDATTWKQCSELACFTEQSFVPYMVVSCTTVQRTQQWAHPEQVDAWMNLLAIEYDSIAETLLLDKLVADAGTPLTVGTVGMNQHGLLAKLIYALGSLSYALGYQFRSDALAGHVVIIPKGMFSAVLADEKLRGFPSAIRTEGEIRSWLGEAFGVTMVERLDEDTSRKAAAAATVVALNAGGAIDGLTTPLLPPSFRLIVIRPDQWLHTQGTLVAADWYVDDSLKRMNKVRYFLENVESLDRLGVQKAHVIDVTADILGTYSDLVAGPNL